MNPAGFKGYQPKGFKRTTLTVPLLEDNPNLVSGAKDSKIDEIDVSDIKHVATKEDWLYLCVIVDLFSRKVVGRSTRSEMKAKIVVELLRQAFSTQKSCDKVVFTATKSGSVSQRRCDEFASESVSIIV